MPKEEGQFTSEKQPKVRKPRGKDKRTLILESLERLGVTEEGFYDRLVLEALGDVGGIGDDSDDNRERKVNHVAFQELWKRFHPVPKPVAPVINFEYPADGTLMDRARAIELGIAEAIIPPDIGVSLLSALAHIAKTEEVTEIKEQLAQLQEIVEQLREKA